MKEYKKIRVKEGPLMYPLPVVMITVGEKKNCNIITVAWTGIVNTHPPMLSISVKKERYSHDIIKKYGEFVVNLVTEDLVKSMDFCGVRSGKNIDKFKETKLTLISAEEVKAPLIAQSPVNLECRVQNIIELPSHDMFLAEIVAAHIDENMIDESGLYKFAEMGLVALNHVGYYRLEKKEIGHFGYSVMKPATRKRKMKEAKRKFANEKKMKDFRKKGKKKQQKEKKICYKASRKK